MVVQSRPGLDRLQRLTLEAGAVAVADPGGAPWTLAVTPESGATVTVEVSVSPPHVIGADGSGATWFALGEPISAAALVVFPGPVTALRLRAADAGATIELVS